MTRGFVLALALFVEACDTTSPRERDTTLAQSVVQFEVCSWPLPPTWVAVRNTGAQWQFVDVPSSANNLPIRMSAWVTPLTSLIIRYPNAAELYQVSREEMSKLRCVPASGGSAEPVREIGGTVTNIPATATFALTFGQSPLFRTGPGPFTGNVRDTTAPVIASYRPTQNGRALRLLFIDAFDSRGRSVFPEFDFASTGTRSIDSAQLSVTGAPNPLNRSTVILSGATTHAIETLASGVSHYFAASPPLN